MAVRIKDRFIHTLGPVFHPLHIPYLMLADAGSWRSFPDWIQSFGEEGWALFHRRPWLPFKAAKWISSYLRPDMRVFEFGSGGSTMFLAERTHQVCSVEHDRSWYELVSKAMIDGGISNCTYTLCEPAINVTGDLDPSERENPELDFGKYISAINRYPDGLFDLILVDGRARASCIRQSIPKVRPGGYLMLDNSNDYRMVNWLGPMDPYPRTDFHGIAPGWPPARWTTSIWQVPGLCHKASECGIGE